MFKTETIRVSENTTAAVNAIQAIENAVWLLIVANEKITASKEKYAEIIKAFDCVNKIAHELLTESVIDNISNRGNETTI